MNTREHTELLVMRPQSTSRGRNINDLTVTVKLLDKSDKPVHTTSCVLSGCSSSMWLSKSMFVSPN